MAQLTIRIPEGGLGVRQGARLPTGGGGITVGGGMLPGPPNLARQDPEVAAAPWLGVKKGADAVTGWAEASMRADQAVEATDAKVRAIGALADAQAEFSGNTGIRNGAELSAAWQARATTIRDEIGANLSRGARQMFDRDFAEMSASRMLNVRNDFATRQGQTVLASLKELSVTAGNAAVSAGNPAARQATINSFNEAVQTHLAAGSINPTQAGQLRMGFLADIDEARIRTAIGSNPSAAIALINNTAETPNIPADRRAALLNSAVTAQQAAATRAQAAATQSLVAEERLARREERLRTDRADEAEKAFRDALRNGNGPGIEAALGVLRRDGRPGAYASAHDAYMGLRENPTTPQMESWLAGRLDGRGDRALTRSELENARANSTINDSVYRRGLDALRAQDNPRYREAEDFLDNALGTPSPTIADRDLQPWQRQAKAQRGAMLNALRLEMRRNPDVDPLAFMQDRLREAPDPAREVERARARQALTTSVPTAAQTPEGLAELQRQLSAHEAYRRLGWAARQSAATVPAPTVDVNGSRRPVTVDDLARWRRIVDQAQ